MENKWIGNCWPDEDRLLLLKAAILSGQTAVDAWRLWLERNEVSFELVDAPSYQLYPLVYRNLAKEGVQGSIFEKCKGIYRRNWTFNQLLWQKLLPYLNHLKQHDIHQIVLLKGMAMIAGYYHDFGARVLGDVDVLIASSQLAKAISVLDCAELKTIGTPVDANNPYEIAIHHAATYGLDDETFLDLHWSFLSESPFTGLDEVVMQRAELIDVHGHSFFIPDPTALLLQTCVHGVKSTTVASLRWIADSMTILNTATIDWKRMLSMAERAHICLPILRAFEYLREHFSAPIPSEVITTLQNRSSTWQENLEYWCNVHGYFFVVNWLRYCGRRGYHSLFSKLIHFPRFIQYRRRLSHWWQVPHYAVRWMIRKIFLRVRKNDV